MLAIVVHDNNSNSELRIRILTIYQRLNKKFLKIIFHDIASVADPWHFGVDPDPDPRSMPLTNGSGSCYFRHWPSRYQQKLIFLTQFFSAYYFLELHLHHLSKIKSQKESQNSSNQGFFFYYFCMTIEGSGSGKPKNMWIRIRNTTHTYISVGAEEPQLNRLLEPEP